MLQQKVGVLENIVRSDAMTWQREVLARNDPVPYSEIRLRGSRARRLPAANELKGQRRRRGE